MNPNKIHVTAGPTLLRDNAITVIGAITARALVSKGEIPLFDPNKNQGYQRAVKKARVNEIVKGIKEKDVDLPTAILISIREDSTTVLSGSDNHLVLNLSSIDKFHIVDGQHRYEAIKILWENEDIPNNYKIPFVCMIGASQDTEMHQFWVVNSTAQKVPTDLAIKLLEKLVKSDSEGKLLSILVEKDTDWKVKGQELLDCLDKSSNIWKGRIRLASAPKAKTTIPSTSMVTSFKKIFKSSPLFDGLDRPRQAQILDAYWKGIQKVMPEDVFSHPEKYSLQKGIGVRTMHGIFPDVLERARGKGSIYSPDIYADIMAELLGNLSGDNGFGNMVQGFDFWIAGKEGAAATYSSNVGIRTLIDKSKKLLPDIDVEDIK